MSEPEESLAAKYAEILAALPAVGTFSGGPGVSTEYPRRKKPNVDAKIESTLAQLTDYLDAVRGVITAVGYHAALVDAAEQDSNLEIKAWATEQLKVAANRVLEARSRASTAEKAALEPLKKLHYLLTIKRAVEADAT